MAVITTHQLLQFLATSMEYIDCDELHHPDAEQRIYSDAEVITRPDASWYCNPQIGTVNGGTQAQIESTPPLTPSQERTLFLRYNYARFRMRQLQIGIPSDGPSTAQVKELTRWYDLAMDHRDQLFGANLALIVWMHNRFPSQDPAITEDILLSAGEDALLQAISKFDISRGIKFSTYAGRSIHNAFLAQVKKAMRDDERLHQYIYLRIAYERPGLLNTFRQDHPGNASLLKRVRAFQPIEPSANRIHHLELAAVLGEVIQNNEAQLTADEESFVLLYFGFSANGETRSMSMRRVAETLGVSQTRVRDIRDAALEKIGAVLRTRINADEALSVLEEDHRQVESERRVEERENACAVEAA